MPKKPKRQNPPERPKALRRASLIEIAAANQDEFDKNKGGILTLSENRSPIHVQKMKEKELLEEGKAAKEFKRCRPVVEMMAHAFTEPDAASRSKLFGEELFPRVPVSEEGHREIRDIKDCHGLTEDDEPGFYNYKDGVFLGDTNKRGVKLLTPLRDIETMDDHMDDQAWRDAMQARMAKFHAKLNQGQGPGWEQFWHIQKEREEVRALPDPPPPFACTVNVYTKPHHTANDRRAFLGMGLRVFARGADERWEPRDARQVEEAVQVCEGQAWVLLEQGDRVDR